MPRKVTIADEDIERFPLAVAEVLHFLGGTGRLDAEEANDLARGAAAIAERFTAAARDRANYGPAKAMATAMLADGVDVHEQNQVDGWIAAYNTSPWSNAAARTASPQPASPAKKRSKTRKAQRQARRRNRGDASRLGNGLGSVVATLLQCGMEDIPARDLRNDVSAVLRRVEAGERLRVTVSGRPVAELVPLPTRPRSIPWDAFIEGAEDWRADPGLTAQLAALVPDTTDDVPVS